MKRLWFLFFVLSSVLFSASAFGDAASGTNDQYYYSITGDWADEVHYATPDAACHVIYNKEAAELVGMGYTVVQSYQSPTIAQNSPPKILMYSCLATGTNPAKNTSNTLSGGFAREGDNCTSSQTYNPVTGLCENPDEDQDHNELGDPSNPPLGGPASCAGDPINAASGNEYESETDYRDADGELIFTRYYNSSTGVWGHSYQTSLYIDPDSNALVLRFEDGHSSLFSVTNGVATGQPTELGNLTQVNGQWVYTSPGNVRLTFDASSGRLVKYQSASGLTQTVAYTTNADYSTTVTVIDSRGHVLTFATATGSPLATLTAGDLTVTYTWNRITNTTTIPSTIISQLIEVASTRGGNTATRTYAYGNTSNPGWLTSVTDERGIVYASWTYDAQGRATSSQHAGGADLTTVTYNSDGSSTVTNALGHSVTFNYQVIQGVKRITSVVGQPTATCPASNSSYTYNARGQVATKIDALGHVTAYTYDSQGRVVTQVEAQGTPQARTTTTTWDATWPYLPDTVTTADRTITYTYDSQGRPLSTTAHDNKE